MTDREAQKPATNVGTPRYVEHDGHRWSVDAEIDLDEHLGYELSRPNVPGMKRLILTAYASDCSPVIAPVRVRKFRDDGVVLEMNTRGQCFVRKAGSRKRYETSLTAIFSMTVKAHVAMQKSLKAAARRKHKGR